MTDFATPASTNLPYNLPSFGQRGLALIADFMLAFVLCILLFNIFYNKLLVEVSKESQVTTVHNEAQGIEEFSVMAEVHDLDTQKISILIIVVYWAYFTFAEYFTKGSSLGKRLFRIQVVGVSGGAQLPFWRTMMRSLVKTVSITQFAFSLSLISVLMMVLTKKRITLHDWLAQSMVIKKSR